MMTESLKQVLYGATAKFNLPEDLVSSISKYVGDDNLCFSYDEAFKMLFYAYIRIKTNKKLSTDLIIAAFVNGLCKCTGTSTLNLTDEKDRCLGCEIFKRGRDFSKPLRVSTCQCLYYNEDKRVLNLLDLACSCDMYHEMYNKDLCTETFMHLTGYNDMCLTCIFAEEYEDSALFCKNCIN